MSAASAYNLIGTGGAGGLVNGHDGNLVGIDNPDLGTLADNGGPTQTCALLPGSLAIDAGSNVLAVDAQDNLLTTDQRGPGFHGLQRGTVDIGAFEVQPHAHVLTSHVVNSLATSQTSDTFPVSVAFSEPALRKQHRRLCRWNLWVSVNNGSFSLYQTMTFALTDSPRHLRLAGQDRNIYGFLKPARQ